MILVCFANVLCPVATTNVQLALRFVKYLFQRLISSSQAFATRLKRSQGERRKKF